MDLKTVENILCWSTLINAGILVWMAFVVFFLRKKVYKIHAKIFGLTEKEVALTFYQTVIRFKLLWFFFNLIPYVAIKLL